MGTTARAETVIAKPAEEVWARIGRFEDLTWFPGFESITVTGEDRAVVTRGVEAQVIERLLERDHGRRTLTYAVVGILGAVEGTTIRLAGGALVDMAPVVGHHRATITVVPAGATSSSVTYDVTLDPGNATMLDALRHGYQAALEHAKGQIEG